MIVKNGNVDDSHIKDYQTFVENHPLASVYHTLDWYQVVQSSYGYRPWYVLAKNEQNELAGFLPLFEVNSVISGRHLSAIPFSHSVTPLYTDQSQLLALVNQAKEIVRQQNCKYLEIRAYSEILKDLGFQFSAHNCISLLDLRVSNEKLWSGLHSSTRRNVRKARKQSLVIERRTHPADFKRFYDLMVETRQHQGTLPYPARLFDALQSMSQVRLYLASYEDTAVAGIVVFCYGTEAIYAYGASTKNSKVLRLRPNDLLFWQVITELQTEGFETFDFGSTPVTHKSLLRFKENWGAKSKPLVYSYWLNTVEQLPVIRRNSKKMKMMSRMIRHVPRWSLRVMGEYFFKQFG